MHLATWAYGLRPLGCREDGGNLSCKASPACRIASHTNLEFASFKFLPSKIIQPIVHPETPCLEMIGFTVQIFNLISNKNQFFSQGLQKDMQVNAIKQKKGNSNTQPHLTIHHQLTLPILSPFSPNASIPTQVRPPFPQPPARAHEYEPYHPR